MCEAHVERICEPDKIGKHVPATYMNTSTRFNMAAMTQHWRKHPDKHKLIKIEEGSLSVWS